MNHKVTFSFGENWEAFVRTVSDESIKSARKDIEEWLGPNAILGKSVLDIGCGSGIHSLVFASMGAKEVVSFDVDEHSVAATLTLWEKVETPSQWKVKKGSILDKPFLQSLGSERFDIVYAWGVLHHTGAIWEAMENASSMVKKGGLYWLSLYEKGPNYHRDLKLKESYNAASPFAKKIMRGRWIAGLMRQRLRWGLNPFRWNEKKERGMDTYHDIVDWLGGLPYEVASVEEVIDFTRRRGFILEKIRTYPEGANNIYLFSLP
jgi:2-polyprenyl-6-hydroxyphenyl methylase/3-demethylubiquinone-9 3-methyltransferase